MRAAGRLAVLMFCLGCGRRTGPPPAAEAGGKPAYGDAYVEASIGDATLLNPILATDASSGDINALVYNGLLKYDKDLRLVGDLAESWTISEGGRVITFHLRDGVRWHDGTPFTSADVAFTYQMLRSSWVRTPYASDFEWVTRLETPDARTVRAVYREPFAPGLASWTMGIIARHVYQEAAGSGAFNEHPANRRPIGTGPYRFVDWKPEDRILLVANTDYFDGRPYLDRYIYRIIPDQAVSFLEMRAQTVDSLGITPDQYFAYKEFFENHRRYRYPSLIYTYLGFRLDHPLFKSHKVRKAIAHAIDKKQIIEGLLLGLGRSSTGPFPQASWAFNPNVKDLPYDPAEAKRLLAEEGWKDSDGDGWLDRDGKRFSFTLMTNQGNKLREQCAQLIQKQLAGLGMEVNIQILEWSTFVHQYVDKRRFDALILGWRLGPDPDQYGIWHSSQRQEGKYNFVGYVNPEVDRLLEEGRREMDFEKRRRIYWRMHEVIARDLPYVFLYVPDSLPAVHRRIQGVIPGKGGIGWNFIRWYSPASQQRYRPVLSPG